MAAGVDKLDIFGGSVTKEENHESAPMPQDNLKDSNTDEDTQKVKEDKTEEKMPSFDFGFNKSTEDSKADNSSFAFGGEASEKELDDLLNFSMDEDFTKAEKTSVMPDANASINKEINENELESKSDDSESIRMLSGSAKSNANEPLEDDDFDKTVDNFDAMVDTAFTKGAEKTKSLGRKVTEKALTFAQNKTVLNKFNSGKRLKSKGFEFSIVDDEVMLMGYYGLDSNLKIPSKVNKIPLRYISPKCFNWYRVKSIKHGFSADGIMDVTADALRDAASGIKSVEFPKTVTRIFDETFSHCKNLESITISNQVSRIYPRAFVNSGLKRINVIGPIPEKLFKNVELGGIEVVSISD